MTGGAGWVMRGNGAAGEPVTGPAGLLFMNNEARPPGAAPPIGALGTFVVLPPLLFIGPLVGGVPPAMP
jgi:hypothetical protein